MTQQAVKWMLQHLLKHGGFRGYLEQQLSPFVPPGHFYSPLPDRKAIEALWPKIYRPDLSLESVRLHTEDQRALLVKLLDYYPSFRWGEKAVSGQRYWLNNDYFGYGDAVILFSMMRHFSPGRIIEIGSGFSSALMLDTNDFFCGGRTRFSFIEPYPHRLWQLLKDEDWKAVEVIERPVQEVPLDIFEHLGHNDILFVDSSHVSKIGSDVNYIVFEVLPRLKDGVLVHFHDIFYPFEYPLDWIREGRAWNEAYLLRAFLQYNDAFEIVLFNSYMGHRFRDYIVDRAPIMAKHFGSSLWLRRSRS
jgi:hypothetical protein